MTTSTSKKQKTKKIVKEVSKVLAGVAIPVISKAVGLDLTEPILQLLKIFF